MALDQAAANAEKEKMLQIFRPDSNVFGLDSNVKLEENPFININSRCMSAICWCAQYTGYKIDVQGTVREVDNFSSVQIAVFCLVSVFFCVLNKTNVGSSKSCSESQPSSPSLLLCVCQTRNTDTEFQN